MDMKELKLSFHELRALVIAVHDRGEGYKDQTLTFSHGNTGNDLQELARKIDNFVSQLEPADLLIVHTAEDICSDDMEQIKALISFKKDLENVQAKFDAVSRQLRARQEFTDAVKSALNGGTFSFFTDAEALAEIDRLKQAATATKLLYADSKVHKAAKKRKR